MTEKKKGMLGRFYGETHKEFESREQEYKRREGELLDAFKRLEENKANVSETEYVRMCNEIQERLDDLDDTFLSPADNLGRYYMRLIDLYETVEKRVAYRVECLETDLYNLRLEVEKLKKEKQND